MCHASHDSHDACRLPWLPMSSAELGKAGRSSRKDGRRWITKHVCEWLPEAMHGSERRPCNGATIVRPSAHLIGGTARMPHRCCALRPRAGARCPAGRSRVKQLRAVCLVASAGPLSEFAHVLLAVGIDTPARQNSPARAQGRRPRDAEALRWIGDDAVHGGVDI